jgi:multiple antibiotic resistance protein
MVAGNVLLTFFGLSLAIVRVGGGLLVITSAWRLVNSPDAGAQIAARAAESFTPEMAKARAFYPLTFPISCGPGSIAAAITVGASLREPDRIVSLVRLAGSLPGILLTSITLYACLRFAAQFLYRLGDNGTAIFMRLSAFVMLCLGVQIVWDGVHELLLGVLVEAVNHVPAAAAK